ncbi:MAG TPA: zinc-binding alcohol dehydrogenase family protein [Solirubrobacteraceae bacterium]|nr:zinc-binding alcohol dehydrogenase family protein [Solirubrobacteraceae bacterium]
MALDDVAAARLLTHGAPLAVERVPLAPPAPGEVQVRLRYGGVNPIDRYNAQGQVNPDGPVPRTLGGEAAGELDGRRVLVCGEGLGGERDGVWAQAANVPVESVVEVPDGVSLQQAAAMGIAGLTAVNCVRHLASVGPDDRVLVLGASGGVGSMIVSLARAARATVWGQTGSAAKVAAIEEAGAERVLVGGPAEISAALMELAPTAVFDPLGGDFVAPVVEATAPAGRIVSFGVSAGPQVTFNIQQLYRKGLSLLGYAGLRVQRDERRAGLVEALEAVRDGQLRVRIDAVLPLDQVNEAFRRLVERRVQGKILLDLS